MYEYDPNTRQYRRKRPDDDASGTSKEPEVPAAIPGVPAEQNPNYAIRDEDDGNYKPPRPPGMTPGKIIFWLVFALIFCGWMYFMYTMYLRDQGAPPPDLESLLEEDEEFQEMMNHDPAITPDDIVVKEDAAATNLQQKAISEPLPPPEVVP